MVLEWLGDVLSWETLGQFGEVLCSWIRLVDVGGELLKLYHKPTVSLFFFF